LIRSKRGLILTGALVLLLGLVILFPARVAFHWFAPAALQISGVQGTAWHGSAIEASVSGVYVRNIKWDIKPLRLLTGALSYRVAATLESGFAESELGIGLGGAISLTDLRAALPLALVAGVSGLPSLHGGEGSVSLNFERLEMLNGFPVAADGVIEIAGLVLPRISRTSLGGYKAEFLTQNNTISGSFEDTDGVVDLVAGSVQINTDRSYTLVIPFAAKPETPASLWQQLQLLPKNERGQHELREEGTL